MPPKSLFFTLAFVLLRIAVAAQFTKGDMMIGTSILSASYNTGTSQVSFPQNIQGYDAKTTSYNPFIDPFAGWFISDDVAIGFAIDLNPTGQKSRYTSGGIAFQQDKATSFNIGGGAFVRKYIGSSESFMPFGQAGFNVGISSQTTEGFKYTSSPNTKNTYSGKSSGGFFANASLILGATKMVGEFTGLDLTLGYLFSYSKNTIKTTTLTDIGNNGTNDETKINEPTTKFTNHGFTLGLGFQVFLHSKRK